MGTHGIALERIRALMARGEDIVFDDTNCFRWLRDRYRESPLALGGGYPGPQWSIRPSASTRTIF